MTEENQKKVLYLKKFKDNEKSARRIEEQIGKLRLDKLYPSFILSDMPRNNNNKDLSDYAAKLDDLINELRIIRLERIDSYVKIIRQIELLDDERERQVLIYKYIEGLSWENVCFKIGYSWPQTHRIHGMALKNIKLPTNDIE